jgi:hypothetical protein
MRLIDTFKALFGSDFEETPEQRFERAIAADKRAIEEEAKADQDYTDSLPDNAAPHRADYVIVWFTEAGFRQIGVCADLAVAREAYDLMLAGDMKFFGKHTRDIRLFHREHFAAGRIDYTMLKFNPACFKASRDYLKDA